MPYVPPPPPEPPPSPEPPPPSAHHDHSDSAGGLAEPPGLLQFDDLLEAVDFDDPDRAVRRPPASARREHTITRLPRPLSAWPMGAG